MAGMPVLPVFPRRPALEEEGRLVTWWLRRRSPIGESRSPGGGGGPLRVRPGRGRRAGLGRARVLLRLLPAPPSRLPAAVLAAAWEVCLSP